MVEPVTKRDQLDRSLHKLETNLETPIVPGELATWLQSLRTSCDEVGRLIDQAVNVDHEDRYREIIENDPALQQRVNKLRQKGTEVLEAFEDFAKQVARLDTRTPERVANEPGSDERLEEITSLGLDFVIQARSHETAVSTWHMEAFQRDRGRAD